MANMDVEDFPPPPPEMLTGGGSFADEDEGEAFEFDDSGDDITETSLPPPAPEGLQVKAPAPAPDPSDIATAGHVGVPVEPPPPPPPPTTTSVTEDAPAVAARTTSAAKETREEENDFPPPPPPSPPPPPAEDISRTGCQGQDSPCNATTLPEAPGHAPRGKVNPYSVIDIMPLQAQQLEQPRGSAPSSPVGPAPSSPVGPAPSSPVGPTPSSPVAGPAAEAQEVPGSPRGVSSGYAIPVPCGYATPSGVPLITPTYTTPVIIRHLSMDEEVTVVATGITSVDSVFSEEYPPIREEDALTKWVSDPANTAWMENPDEVIYDDVPRENSDSNTDPDDMIYDDVELGEEGEGGGGRGPGSDTGWSSSEFESYDEASDGEGRPENGTPHAFMRGKPPQRKTHLSQDLTRLKEHYERKMKELMANTVGTVELQQLKQRHEQKMQKLVKAAREGTKDGLEKTKAAVKKGRSFIKTKSFCHERKSAGFEDEETELFIEVDCFNVEPVLGPAPEGLSQQQLVRRCILGSILESEKNYLDALKRILEQYEKPLSQVEPRLLSDRKLKMIFYRVREILQCHFLFQIALASRVADWDNLEMIGDVFVASFSKSMVLDAYSEYVNNFSTAMAVVRKTCAAKPSFLDFLKHRQETSGDRVTLYGLMMKPIQRFPQFILLLQDMLKNTPVGHGDRLPLQMALTELETLADKLNERKREADQRCEIRHIAKAMNERYLNKLLSNGSRHLIRSDDMVETVYNERGEIIKTKERRLFLLNDVLMCATPNIRCSQDSIANASGNGSTSGNGSVSGMGSPSLPGHKFLLKWSVPLGLADVVEFGSSEDAPDTGRPPATHHHSGEKVVINAKPSKLYMGPGQLYQDLQNLIHDLSLVNQISGMISSLKGNYQNVNPAVAQDWVSGLQRLILKKEEEIRAADRCRIQLQLPGKHDKTGKPTYFNAVFNTFSPAIKQSWISNLQMAKLALEEDNVQGWFFAEDDVSQIKKQKHPLLLRQMPVVMSKLQEFKVECAVHNPEPHINTESTADSPALGHGCVWVASCTNQMGQIAIVAMQSSNPKVTECFNVESRILCMAYVPAELPAPESDAAQEAQPRPPGRTSDTPAVCLGMEEGSIIVYKSSQRSKKVRLQHFFTPDKSTVTSLVHRRRCLYAGLVTGSVAIYSRQQDGLWSWEQPMLLSLGVLPVKAMLAVEDHVWVSCGGHVFVISTHTHSVERQLEAHQEEGMVVSHMVVAGVGIWIAFSSGSTLRLFHTETLEHLQDINIATPVHNILAGTQRVSVSSLLVCYGLLLVGTNLGVTVALSVPRLQGIPKVTGRGMVSFHAHHGPVRFLTMAAAVCNRTSGDQPAVPSPAAAQPADPTHDPGEKSGESPEPGPSPGPAPSHQQQRRGVWLGEAGCTAMALQDSLSSSSCGSLAPSQGSLEHGPEDGALYDLLHDPAQQQQQQRGRGSPAGKVDVSSLLVVSGGLGHRRVNRKGKPARHEDSASTIMVWQIPLLNM